MKATPKSCEDLLARMIEFDTVVAYHSGLENPERELSGWLAQVATSWGFAERQLPIAGSCHNLLLELRVDDAAPWLLLDSHLDTVGTEGMTIAPFEPTVRDGKMYGRGACDTKGTGAAMLWALREYAAAKKRPNNVAILYSVGEEHVQTGARAFVEQHQASLDWQPTAVVAGEPTEMNTLAANGGFIRWKMTTRGKACHSSRPERGHNAIYDLAQLITTLEAEYIGRIESCDPLVGHASAAITVVQGGQQVNVVPSEATITFDRRLVPGEQADVELEKVKSIAAKVASQRSGMQVEHHQFESAPPMAQIDQGNLARQVQASLVGVGIESQIKGELFTTNGNHFAAGGLPTVVMGPGSIDQAHQPDEWISLEQLALGVQGYAAVMGIPLKNN